IENTYGAPGSPDARMGRVSRSVVTTRRTQPVDGNNVPIVHATEYEYDFGIVRGTSFPAPLIKKKVEPGSGAPIELHTAYAYDFRGNVRTTTECQDQFAGCV